VAATIGDQTMPRTAVPAEETVEELYQE